MNSHLQFQKTPVQPLATTTNFTPGTPSWVKTFYQASPGELIPDPPLKKITILLVEHQQMLCQGLKFLLQHQKQLAIVGEATQAVEGLRFAAELQPDLVIFDAQLPDLAASQLLKQLSRLEKKPHLLALAARCEPKIFRILTNLGVTAFVDKNDSVQHLVDAVLICHQGRRVIPANWDAEAFDTEDGNIEVSLSLLSKRELEVLRLLLSNQRYNNIAEVLSISRKTLETHIGRVFEKLGVSSRTELLVEANELHLLLANY